MVVGAVHLLLLYAQRHADVSWFPAELAVHTARSASKLLDMLQPADRSGRWLPDPTVPPTEATPVAWPASTEVDRIAEMAHLARALSEILGEVPPLTIHTLTDIATHPDAWKSRLDRATEDQAVATALLALVTDYMELSRSMVRQLLHLEDLHQIEEPLVEQAAAWFDSARLLLDQVSTIAGSDTSALS